MPASSQRKGRKLNRPSGCGPRLPACRSCKQRRVACDGGDPCAACIRKAAWDGVPPPTPGPGGGCEYEGGQAPGRRARVRAAAGKGKSKAAESGRSRSRDHGEDAEDDALPSASSSCSSSSDDEDADFASSAAKSRPVKRSAKAKGKARAKEPVEVAAGGGKTRGGKAAARPLQKGLACLGCKARRVRCDGLKPQCTACSRLSERQEGVECVYRADLWVRQHQEERGERVKQEDEDWDHPHPHSHPHPHPAPTAVKPEPADFVLPPPELLPPLPPLPPASQLPPLPPAPIAAPAPAPVAPPPQPQPAFATPADPAAYAAASPMSLASIFSNLPYPYAAPGASFSHAASSTAPPSPAYSSSTPSLSYISSAWSTHSSSAFPSPRTPLDDFLHRHRMGNYPPVPYPSTGHGVNPFWVTTNEIPPLAMADDKIEEFFGIGAPLHPPQVGGSALGLEGAVGPAKSLVEQAIATAGAAQGQVHSAVDEELTLTLPMMPAFQKEWY